MLWQSRTPPETQTDYLDSFTNPCGEVRFDAISSRQGRGPRAKKGTNKLLTRKGKELEVKVPPGVKSGNVLKLSDACQADRWLSRDILIKIKTR